MPFAEEIRAALLKSHATPLQQNLLRKLVQGPQTASALAKELGLLHHVTVNNALGNLGRSVRKHLSAHPEGLAEGDYQWWNILATGQQRNKGFEWTLRPEVLTAMSKLGWLAEHDFRLPEESGVAEIGTEGAVQTITVNRYERDHRLRATCIRHYGARCFVCGIDMGKVYGEYAQGLIHVHHLVPIAEAKGPKTVDPIRDMRPLCPNCHAVAHQRSTPFTMEELHKMLRHQK